MRKLMSKKGFTLVELMIVVVILGILVAVAVPIFGAVTKNARVKSCKSNQRVIKGNIETYAMTGAADGGQVNFATGSTNVATEANFIKLFDGGKLPTCPSGTDAEKTAGTYSAYVVVTDANTSFSVACTTAKAADEGHNAA